MPTFRQRKNWQKKFWGVFWAIHSLEVPQQICLCSLISGRDEVLWGKKLSLSTLLDRLTRTCVWQPEHSGTKQFAFVLGVFLLNLAYKENVFHKRKGTLPGRRDASVEIQTFCVAPSFRKRKPSRPKCYTFLMVGKATFCYILPSKTSTA